MPTSDLQVGTGKPGTGKAQAREPVYQPTFVDQPFFLVSLFRQIRAQLREPKIVIPAKYYRGEARLPFTEMPPWYRDLPSQLKILFEKPGDPIGAFNYSQEEKRVLCALGSAVVGAAAGWAIKGGQAIAWGAILGAVLGRVLAQFLFKNRPYPPEIFQDYQQQVASWVNSALIHALALAAMILPFAVERMLRPVKASSKYEVVDISPYLANLPGADKKAGGGGGGGDRSPTPASKGAVPKFAKDQLAPPMAVLPNLTPKLPAQPTLVGPPELKLPQMALNAPWGDPQGVLGPPSNGPGFGGGIGSGEGTGIGSGRGGGLGPGEGGGTGGGPYSVGGSIGAPIPIYKPDPPYSEEARKAKYQGTVVLWIVVDTQGNVTEIRVVKPLGLGLDEKAVDTVRTWKFKPATRNGIPVPVRVAVEVSFRLF